MFFLFLFLLPVYQYRIKFRSLLEAHFSMIDVAFDQHYDISVRKLRVSYKMTPINMIALFSWNLTKKNFNIIYYVGRFICSFFSRKIWNKKYDTLNHQWYASIEQSLTFFCSIGSNLDLWVRFVTKKKLIKQRSIRIFDRDQNWK